jgi:hypothetical protein
MPHGVDIGAAAFSALIFHRNSGRQMGSIGLLVSASIGTVNAVVFRHEAALVTANDSTASKED